MFGSCVTHGFEVRDNGFRHCKYCGSIHPEDLYNLLIEGKVTLGGSDWKYGWPHKFYVYEKGNLRLSGAKFYNNHLSTELLDEETFNKVVDTINLHSGITFERKEGKLYYSAPYAGYQKMSWQ